VDPSSHNTNPADVFDGDAYELSEPSEDHDAAALEAVRSFVAEFKVLPTTASWTAAGMVPTERTILRRFGSFRSAVTRAGLV
jgi:Homing endonuclease associated repeat